MLGGSFSSNGHTGAGGMHELQGAGKVTSQAEKLINPCVKGMLDAAARTPSHPKWQEIRVLHRKATFLSAWFMTISCILPYSVPICCRFSKSLLQTEKLQVKIEPFVSRKQKWSRKAMKSMPCAHPTQEHVDFRTSSETTSWTWVPPYGNTAICTLHPERSQFVSAASILHLYWGPNWGLNSWTFFLLSFCTSGNVLNSVSHRRTWRIFLN